MKFALPKSLATFQVKLTIIKVCVEVFHMFLHFQNYSIRDIRAILAQFVKRVVIRGIQTTRQLIGHSHNAIIPYTASAKAPLDDRSDLVDREMGISLEVVCPH